MIIKDIKCISALVVFITLLMHGLGLGAALSPEEKVYETYKNAAETESYVIVVYSAKIDPSRKKPTLNIQGTIVGVVKGAKKIGTQIKFSQVSDVEFIESNYIGGFYLVQYHKAKQDNISKDVYYVRATHPGGFIKCNNKLFDLVQKKTFSSPLQK